MEAIGANPPPFPFKSYASGPHAPTMQISTLATDGSASVPVALRVSAGPAVTAANIATPAAIIADVTDESDPFF